jgi:hypothetical protein
MGLEVRGLGFLDLGWWSMPKGTGKMGLGLAPQLTEVGEHDPMWRDARAAAGPTAVTRAVAPLLGWWTTTSRRGRWCG